MGDMTSAEHDERIENLTAAWKAASSAEQKVWGRWLAAGGVERIRLYREVKSLRAVAQKAYEALMVAQTEAMEAA
jgi:hypothetical protein